MCEVCLQHPCHPRCPNADEPVVRKCDVCKGNIYEGDTMYAIDSMYICENCVEDGKTYAEFEGWD